MIQPGVFNINLQRRADYSLGLQFRDSEGAGIDLTGATVVAQAWNVQRKKKYADFNVEYTDRVSGDINISLNHGQTVDFPSELVYDVLVVYPDGTREYYLEGAINVSQGYTAFDP